MKTKHLLASALAAAMLYGCVAMPAFTQYNFTKEDVQVTAAPQPAEGSATIVMGVWDIDTKASVFYACAPVSPEAVRNMK